MTIAWASKEEFLDQLEFYDLELRYIKGMSRIHQLQDLCLSLRKLCGWLICLPDTKIEKEMVSREAKETQVWVVDTEQVVAIVANKGGTWAVEYYRFDFSDQIFVDRQCLYAHICHVNMLTHICVSIFT